MFKVALILVVVCHFGKRFKVAIEFMLPPYNSAGITPCTAALEEVVPHERHPTRKTIIHRLVNVADIDRSSLGDIFKRNDELASILINNNSIRRAGVINQVTRPVQPRANPHLAPCSRNPKAINFK